MRGLGAWLLIVSACGFEIRPQAIQDGMPAADGGPEIDAAVDGALPQDGAPPPDAGIDAFANPCTGYTMMGGSSYRVSTADATWDAARLACEATGGYLVVIANPTENTTVRGLLPMTTRFWMGMSDLATEDTWLWLDGTSVPRAAQYWDPNQPNNSQANGGEDCGEMSNSGAWNDDNCNAVQPYVCECTPG